MIRGGGVSGLRSVDDDGSHAALAAIERAESFDELRSLAESYLRSAGVSRAVYHHVPPMGHPDADVVRVAVVDFPEDVVARYVGKQLYRRNPVFLRALSSTSPAAASTYGSPEGSDPDPDAIFAELRKLVPGDWLMIPVFGPSARNGTFSLVFEEALPAVDSAVVRGLEAFCQEVHVRVCHLVEAAHAEPPKLSEREITVLGWVARGKSNGEIATILDISRHTVDAHLRSLYLKLDVTERVSAAIRGVGYGYILRVET